MKIFLAVVFLFCARQVFAQESAAPDIFRKADQLINDYNFGQALHVLGAAGDTVDMSVLRRMGYCHSKLGNYSEAIVVYEQMRSIDSLNKESLFSLGQLYSQTNQYDLSKKCMQKLIDLDSTNSFYYKQFAALATKTNNPISAIGFYIKTIRLNPKDMEAYGLLSAILIDAEQYAYVDSMLTPVLAQSENNQLRLLLARAKLGQDKFEDVIQHVDTILQSNDTTATYARLLGISYFLLDRYEQVIPCMEFLTAMGAKESISDHIGSYYTQLASVYEEVRDYPNAIRNYKVAYETSKADILLYHLARNYDVYYKDKTQAQVYYQKYLESDDTVTLAKTYSKQRLNMLSGPR